ncbi:MAG: SufE family protein [Candidatus Aminicenantes bacterium]|nr:MAG: SufE family protein [Candidatus Aminicenantes bacterium]
MKNTINDIQDKIIEEFSGLDDWIDKYEYLIDLGKRLNPLALTLKTEKNSMKGCQSKVWINAELKDGRLCFFADSDALITKGLIALLLQVLNNQTPKDIVNSDLYFIEKMGLNVHLSPSRANGLMSIVKQIKWYGLKYHTREIQQY